MKFLLWLFAVQTCFFSFHQRMWVYSLWKRLGHSRHQSHLRGKVLAGRLMGDSNGLSEPKPDDCIVSDATHILYAAPALN